MDSRREVGNVERVFFFFSFNGKYRGVSFLFLMIWSNSAHMCDRAASTVISTKCLELVENLLSHGSRKMLICGWMSIKILFFFLQMPKCIKCLQESLDLYECFFVHLSVLVFFRMN